MGRLAWTGRSAAIMAGGCRRPAVPHRRGRAPRRRAGRAGRRGARPPGAARARSRGSTAATTRRCRAESARPGSRHASASRRPGVCSLTVTDWSITRVDCAGPRRTTRRPNCSSATYSGGAHCCETLRVWTPGAAGAAEAARVRGRATPAGSTCATSTATAGGSWCSATTRSPTSTTSATRAPRAASRWSPAGRRDGFDDCTRQFPDVLRAALARLRRTAVASRQRRRGSPVRQRARRSASSRCPSLLDEEEAGLETIRRAVGERRSHEVAGAGPPAGPRLGPDAREEAED